MKSKASDDICTVCSLSSSLPLQIWCIDCGEVVEVSEFDSKTCRCKDCQNKADYTPIGTKIVKCMDCGKDIKVNSKNNRTHRCDCCQKEYIKKYDRARKVLNINYLVSKNLFPNAIQPDATNPHYKNWIYRNTPELEAALAEYEPFKRAQR